MRSVCLLISFIVICPCCFAQEPGGIKPGTDTAAINKLILAAHKVLNPDSAIVLFDRIFKMSREANYADGAFIALITRSIKYNEKEDYENQRNSGEEALSWATRSSIPDAVAWCNNNIGDAFFNEGDYIKASEYFYIALEELKKIPPKPTHTAVNIYANLGVVNIRIGQPAKAMGYFNQAEGIAREGKLDYQLAQCFEFKGDYYTSIHKIDSALKYFNDEMDIGKNIGKVDLQATANRDLGKTYIAAGEYLKAITYLQTAISLAKNHFPYIVVDASYSLGDAWYHLHKYKDAETILTSALQEILSHNYKDNYINCYTKLIAVYKATGQYKKALDFMDTVAILKDSLTSAEKARAINRMEINFKTAEKDKQIAQSELLIVQQKNKLTRKNIWIGSIAGGVFLLSLISIGFYSRARNKQRLQAGQIKTLQQENTISILKGVVQGEENERSRIARELHDGIGGMLSAAMMRFMAIRHENAEVTKSTAYREGMDTLGEMGDEIRKTAHNLMPEVLLKQNLPDALAAYCNSMRSAAAGLQTDFQYFGVFDNITQEFKLSAYRIVQELLKNIRQHAAATKVLVELQMHEHILAITVEDNGVGFDTAKVISGMGLQNLQTRVRSFGGQYTLESAPGKGTSVYIEFDTQKVTEPK